MNAQGILTGMVAVSVVILLTALSFHALQKTTSTTTLAGQKIVEGVRADWTKVRMVFTKTAADAMADHVYLGINPGSCAGINLGQDFLGKIDAYFDQAEQFLLQNYDVNCEAHVITDLSGVDGGPAGFPSITSLGSVKNDENTLVSLSCTRAHTGTHATHQSYFKMNKRVEYRDESGAPWNNTNFPCRLAVKDLVYYTTPFTADLNDMTPP